MSEFTVVIHFMDWKIQFNMVRKVRRLFLIPANAVGCNFRNNNAIPHMMKSNIADSIKC